MNVLIKYCLGVFLALSFPYSAQQSYNACNQALELCPNQLFSVDNIGANVTFCSTCEDNFTFCFTPNNSIWLTFVTNASGGGVSVDFSNPVFQTGVGQGNEIQAALLQATVPCDPASYTNLGNCESNQSANFQINASGLLPNTSYYIVLSGANGASTPAEFSVDVQISGPAVDRIPPSMALSYPATLCGNELFTAFVSLSNCPNQTQFSWYVNGNLTAITTDTVFQSSNLQTNDILSVECSCFSICPEAINAISLPLVVSTNTVNAGVDMVLQPGDTVQLSGTSNASIFQWTPSFALSNDTILAPFAFPTQTTLYTLTVSDGLGCFFSDEVLLTILQPLMIPNTFSPNNDGRNDTWVIPGIENYPDVSIFIADRWGQEVFQTSGYSAQTAWKGESNNGNVLTEGVYFYIIDLNDGSDQQFKGSLTLIR